MTNVPEHSEFETKYRVDYADLIPFKKKAAQVDPAHSFIYVQGFDHFFVKEGSPFIRVRISDYPIADTGKYYIQLTSKQKPEGAKNNILRKEINLQLDDNKPKTIFAFLEMIGYKESFKIWKKCHIYMVNDDTLVYYSVDDGSGWVSNFIEIELSEIKPITEEDGFQKIGEYEKLLGLSAQRRLKRSLFEMYSPNEK